MDLAIFNRKARSYMSVSVSVSSFSFPDPFLKDQTVSYALIIFWLGGFKPLSSRPTQSHSPFASLKAPIKEVMTRLPKRKRNKKKDKDGFWFLALLGHQPTARQAWWLALSLHTLMLCTERVKVGVRIRLVSRAPQVIPDRSRPISFGPPSIGWCNCSIVWATSL